MRIVFIIAGAGQAYCGSCLRDHAYVRHLRALGIDALVLPAYLPPRFEHPDDGTELTPVLGGISVYLLARYRWARVLPEGVLRLLDGPKLLRWAARYESSTDPAELGQLAVEMMKGPEGEAAPEFHLAARRVRDLHPDVVVLPNLMLTPLAPLLKAEAIPRVVAFAAGEPPFIDQLGESEAATVWQWIKHWLPTIDLVLTFSHYYRHLLLDRLAPPGPVEVLPLPVDLPPVPLSARNRPSRTLVYLSRIVPQKGLDRLIRAAGRLPMPLRSEIRLEVAGSLPPSQRRFLANCLELAAKRDVAARYLGDLSADAKWSLLGRAYLWALPTDVPDTQNLATIEALGAGTVAVVPGHGWYPEIVESTGGGVLFPPGDEEALTEALRQLLGDQKLRDALADRGQRTVYERHAAPRAARCFLERLESIGAKPASTT